MSDISTTLSALQVLCISIQRFIDHEVDSAIFHAPIIDHFHPSDYSQRGIQGLRKFLTNAKSEVDYVEGLARSPVPPKEFTTNAPHISAVWEEFIRAPRPLGVISQLLDCGDEGSVKLDVVADGGNEWIKVNTEQDSYDNSDYDSDASSTSTKPDGRSDPAAHALSSSLITQAESLVRASKAFVRPKGQPIPRIKLVLRRIQVTEPFDDPRIEETFIAIRQMGITLQFGSTVTSPLSSSPSSLLQPSSNIVLDLSVLVALCCDSTHQPLPTTPEELESRFRPLQISPNGQVELAPHTNVSSDLRDQLKWEMEHPLIAELQDRLASLVSRDQQPIFWVTEEVKDRLPKLVEVIGGPSEKCRAKALFDEGEATADFWNDSRWKGSEGVLRDLTIRVLPDLEGECGSPTDFDRGIIAACRTFLDLAQPRSDLPDPRSPSPLHTPGKPLYPPKHKRGKRNASFQVSRLPTGHTLRTLLAGATRGWTVLTNNRGAIGKICREIGVHDGISNVQGDQSGPRRASVWVVNPSSLAEWRRMEVEVSNRAISDMGHKGSPRKAEIRG